ncbi:hypothetical protein FQN51_008441 [Onygenales sp. PD_10]|nr:hypothetical protein FQN51_008441 [Onygenales sp. PD_10]
MTTPDIFRDAPFIANVSNIHPVAYDDDGEEARPRAPEITARKVAYTDSKIAMLDKLVRDLDLLIYCQLSAIYYMDCSTLHFLNRAIIQLIYFTPKHPSLPERSANEPSVIAGIFVSNLFCMLLHYLSSNPSAGEATRGYLHGGLFIDFIGEKGPISKFRLLLFDLLVLVLQIVIMCIYQEREKTKADAVEPPNTQDHDAEERGEYAATYLQHLHDPEIQEDPSTTGEIRAPAPEPSTNDIQPLLTSPGSPAIEDTPAPAYPHPRDSLISAQTTIADIHIFRNIYNQWYHVPATTNATQPTPPPANQNALVTFLQRQVGSQIRSIG